MEEGGDRVIVEYRVRRDGGADRGLPNPGRWVVAHRWLDDTALASIESALAAAATRADVNR
ncbi:hypothetical protein ACIGW7_11505 [Streptomyces sp. NPDC053253]|uniref:hypothetical protein n=1 Tax=unclassified Streptomyces TaxID=2593676 RepID=UPI003316B129